MADEQLTVPYKKGYDYGIGVDSMTGSPMALAVEGAVSGVGAEGDAATVSFDVTRITTTESLERSLGISAEASYGCGAFGAGVSARFDFARKCQIQSSSLFFIVNATVELGFEQIDDPKLTADAMQTAGQPTEFGNRYGNMFVRGIDRGGIFIGVLRIDTEAETDAEDISAKIEGRYGLLSAEAEAKFKEVKTKFMGSIHCSMYHEGGPVDLGLADPTDPKQLLDNANKFLTSFKDDRKGNARSYSVTLARMGIAKGPQPPNAAELQKAQDVLAFCTRARSQVLDKINLLMFIDANATKYTMPPAGAAVDLSTSMKLFQKDYDIIQNCAASAMHEPVKARMPSDFDASYPNGKMPDPMPTPKEGKVATVPDLNGCTGWQDVNDRITKAGLIAHQQTGNVPIGDEFGILSVTPPPGTPLTAGETVTVITKPVRPKIVGRFVWRGDLRSPLAQRIR